MSRLQKIGTIFSRVKSLLEKGVIKEEDKPLWFDVYARFPPKFEPTFTRPAPEREIPEIFYPEDVVRAELHKKFPNKLGLIDFKNKYETNSQKWIKMYFEYVAKGLSEKEALEKVSEELKS